jgi:cell division protein FtsB
MGQNQLSKGNEDEAPEEEGSKTALVMEGGLERLELLSKFKDGLKKTNKVLATQERDIRKEIKKASDDILHLAHAAKVRAGKVCIEDVSPKHD